MLVSRVRLSWSAQLSRSVSQDLRTPGGEDPMKDGMVMVMVMVMGSGDQCGIAYARVFISTVLLLAWCCIDCPSRCH